MVSLRPVLLIQTLLASIAHAFPAAASAAATNGTVATNSTVPANATVFLDALNTTVLQTFANTPVNNFAVLADVTPTLLSNADQDSYLPAIHFASPAYYDASVLTSWTCPVDCKASATTGGSPNFTNVVTNGPATFTTIPNPIFFLPPVSVGSLPWYVGFNPGNQNVTLAGVNNGKGTVVVGIRGTFDGTVLLQNGVDNLVTPSSKYFPNVGSAARVHQGYQAAFQLTADAIIAAVKASLARNNATAVLVTGHSQGAALTLYQAIALRNALPSNILISAIGFAMPRTGNLAWTNYVDGRNLNVLRHIGHGSDPIPVSPPMSADGTGYRQVTGEVHIFTRSNIQDGKRRPWYSCPGKDNKNALCQAGVIGDRTALAAAADVIDFRFHSGPYDNFCMGVPVCQVGFSLKA